MCYSVDEVSQCILTQHLFFTPRYVLDVLIYIYIYTLTLNLLYVNSLKNELTSWTD